MKEKTHFMAHQQASAQSDDRIPSQDQPLKLNETQQSEDSDSDKDDTESQSQSQSQPQRLSASETCLCNKEEMALQLQEVDFAAADVTRGSGEGEEISGRERLKRHRVEVAGRVWIPERWGQEEMLKDWIDCSAFDAPLVPSRIMTARAALVQEGTRANAAGFRKRTGVESSFPCSSWLY